MSTHPSKRTRRVNYEDGFEFSAALYRATEAVKQELEVFVCG